VATYDELLHFNATLIKRSCLCTKEPCHEDEWGNGGDWLTSYPMGRSHQHPLGRELCGCGTHLTKGGKEEKNTSEQWQ